MKRDERRKFPYYGILPLILTLTANFIAYFGTRPFTSSWKHYNIETVLDQQIPVIPWTIVIYFGCYLVWIVNYLIAASREKNRSEGDWVKALTPDEMQLVGDILKEYLA